MLFIFFNSCCQFQQCNVRIWDTFFQATFLMLVKTLRRPHIVLEQPRGSWMLKLPCMLEFFNKHGIQKVSTHLCFWVFCHFNSEYFHSLFILLLFVFLITIKTWIFFIFTFWDPRNCNNRRFGLHTLFILFGDSTSTSFGHSGAIDLIPRSKYVSYNSFKHFLFLL